MRLALFDFDGTLTQGDSYLPFIYFATARARVATFGAALSPWVLAYKLGRYPATKMRAMVSWCSFAGRSVSEVTEQGQKFADGLGKTLREDALLSLKRHQSMGDQVVIVSASLSPYLKPFSAELGVELICTELEEVRGRLTGRYAGGDCAGDAKAQRVQARYDLSRYSEVFAYGDTTEDLPMLGLAQHRFFRGKPL